MANAFRTSLVMSKALADAFDDRINTGGAVASVRLYDDTAARPADVDTAISTQVLLAELLMNATAFGAAADAAPGGIITAAAIGDDVSADATGTLVFFRIVSDNSGSPDDECGGEAGTSGADLNMNTLAITSGSTVSITAMTVTMPES